MALPQGGRPRDVLLADLDDIAAELNGRPREALGRAAPAERFLELAEVG